MGESKGYVRIRKRRTIAKHGQNGMGWCSGRAKEVYPGHARPKEGTVALCFLLLKEDQQISGKECVSGIPVGRLIKSTGCFPRDARDCGVCSQLHVGNNFDDL